MYININAKVCLVAPVLLVYAKYKVQKKDASISFKNAMRLYLLCEV